MQRQQEVTSTPECEIAGIFRPRCTGHSSKSRDQKGGKLLISESIFEK